MMKHVPPNRFAGYVVVIMIEFIWYYNTNFCIVVIGYRNGKFYKMGGIRCRIRAAIEKVGLCSYLSFVQTHDTLIVS
jgi:hypothetical protein